MTTQIESAIATIATLGYEPDVFSHAEIEHSLSVNDNDLMG